MKTKNKPPTLKEIAVRPARYGPKQQTISAKVAEQRRVEQVLAFLEIFHRAYQEEKNPLDAIEAFQIARQQKVPIPDWVLGYFDGIASRLLKIKSSKDVASKVLAALQLDTDAGRGTIFSRDANQNKRRLAVDIYERLRRERREETAAVIYGYVVLELADMGLGDYAVNTIKTWISKSKS